MEWTDCYPDSVSFTHLNFNFFFILELELDRDALSSYFLFYSEGINHIKDSLSFHVYDEIIEDLPNANDTNTMSSTMEIYQKISSHYLGELLIPFSTIYASQRVSFIKKKHTN